MSAELFFEMIGKLAVVMLIVVFIFWWFWAWACIIELNKIHKKEIREVRKND